MIFSYLIIFTCLWWVIFFMVLPFGNQITKKPRAGHADSAPTNPRLLLKVLVTTILTILSTYITVKILNVQL
ncbi:MAG: DUF1467 family protein [Pseudomonadota bacterium]